MGHVVDFNPEKTERKRLKRQQEDAAAADQARAAAAGIAPIAPVPTLHESQASLKQAIAKSEQKAAETVYQLPIRGAYAIQNRISAVEVSRLQQRDGARTCVVFVGKMMYYASPGSEARMWKFDGSYAPNVIPCPSWFPMMTPYELGKLAAFSPEAREILATAMQQCLNAGAKRLAAKQYGGS